MNKRLFVLWVSVMMLTLVVVMYYWNNETDESEHASLRTLALKRNLWIGTEVNMKPLSSEPQYSKVLAGNYNMLTPENAMKFEYIHPSLEIYNFIDPDKLVEFAVQNHMKVRGHTLVWDEQLPDWVTKGDYNKEQLKDILKEHIQTVMKHYQGKIMAWDVVNEAFSNDGQLKDTFWKNSIGSDYLELAFRWAHEADPKALLFYNDNRNEEINPKSDAIYAMIKDFKKKGVHIDGVGFQMHVSVGNAVDQVSMLKNMKRLAKLNIQVHITEMDVKVNDSIFQSKGTFKKQAEIYAETLQSCLSSDNCKAFVTWGFTDRYTWLSTPGKEEKPLLFDKEYTPKAAYDAVKSVLEGRDY